MVLVVRMTVATRESAVAIAQFLADKEGRMRIGSIAELAGCPIRPPQEGNPLAPHSKGIVGREPHCQRVKAALEAAVKLGLVRKEQVLGRGPWYYSVAAKAAAR